MIDSRKSTRGLLWTINASGGHLNLSNLFRINATTTGHRFSLPEMAPRVDAENPHRKNLNVL
jgi:hypothetical protein